MQNFFFLNKLLEDMSPFCGATDTPILDFWWRLLWVSKPEWVLPYSSLAEAYLLCYTFNAELIPAEEYQRFENWFKTLLTNEVLRINIAFFWGGEGNCV